MLFYLLLELTPAQRRSIVELCSYSDYSIKFVEHREFFYLDSAVRGEEEEQFAESSSRAIIVGTDMQYLKKLEEEYYAYSQFSEVRMLLIESVTRIGTLYDMLTDLVKQQEVEFVIFPVGVCTRPKTALKYLYADIEETTHAYPAEAETRAFTKVLNEVFKMNRGYVCYENPDSAFCYTTQPLREISLLATPYFHYADAMAELITICPVSFSGVSLTNAECLVSVAEPKITMKTGLSHDIGTSLVQAANFISTLYQLHEEVSMNKIQRVVVQITKQAKHTFIESSLYNLHKPGQGFGIITQKLLATYLKTITVKETKNTEPGRIFSFVVSNVSNYGIVNVTPAKLSHYSSFESHKIGVLLRNVGSEIYDAHQTHTRSNLTNAQLRLLKGYNVYLFDHTQKKIMKIGVLGHDNHAMVTSELNVNNFVPWESQLVVSPHIYTSINMSKLKMVPLPLDVRFAVLFSGYHTNISVTIINPESCEKTIFFTMAMQSFIEYNLYYQCQDGGSRVLQASIQKVNDMYKYTNPGYTGYCRLIICDKNMPKSQIAYLSERCGESVKIRIARQIKLRCWWFCILVIVLLWLSGVTLFMVPCVGTVMQKEQPQVVVKTRSTPINRYAVATL